MGCPGLHTSIPEVSSCGSLRWWGQSGWGFGCLGRWVFGALAKGLCVSWGEGRCSWP